MDRQSHCGIGVGCGFAMPNLGSSTEKFREIEQPCIEKRIIALGEVRGHYLFMPTSRKLPRSIWQETYTVRAFHAKLAAPARRGILCRNMFEHVPNRSKLADICMTLIRPGRYIIVSVPKSLDPAA